MRHGTKLATTLAVTLTVFSGIAAVGATTGLLAGGPDSAPGTARLIEPTNAGVSEQALVPAPAGAEPGTATRQAPSPGPGVVAGNRAVTAAGSAPIPAPASARSANSGAVSVAAPLADGAPAAPPSTTPTTPVVAPVAPAPDCHGSDDGMSEAEKQARERACAEGHDDD